MMKRCLIVDDAVVIRRVARHILGGFNLSVEEAPDGEAALTKCCESMPDAIFVDWHMPGMDGISFVRELREMPGGNKPKVLLCGTVNDVVHLTQAKRAGADAYMLKPFDHAIVVEKFRTLGMI